MTADLEDGGANPDATPAARNMERTAANFIVAEQKLPSPSLRVLVCGVVVLSRIVEFVFLDVLLEVVACKTAFYTFLMMR